MEVSCPGCGNRLPLSQGIPAEQGLLRLTCANCSRKLLLKVSRPDLKVSQSDLKPTTHTPEPDPPPKSVATAQDQPRAQAGDAATRWTLHVDEFPPESLTALRAVLTQVPRYSRNPNKVFDMTAELPYEFSHLNHEQVSCLETCLDDFRARYRTAPQP